MKDKQRKSKKDDNKGKHTNSRSKKHKCTDDDEDSKKGKHTSTAMTIEPKHDETSEDDFYGGDGLGESLAVEAKNRKKSTSFEIHVSKVFEDAVLNLATVVAL